MNKVIVRQPWLKLLTVLMTLSVFTVSGCQTNSTRTVAEKPPAEEIAQQATLLDYAVEPSTGLETEAQPSDTSPADQEVAGKKILLQLVTEAKRSSSPRREALLIKATHSALGLDNTSLATRIYSLINTNALDSTSDLDYFYELIGLELAVAQQDRNRAASTLNALDGISNSRKIPLNPSHYLKDSYIRASALALQENFLGAARLLVFRFEGIAQPDLQVMQDRHNRVWDYISLHRHKKLSGTEKNKPLAIQLTTAPSDEWQAWLELSDVFEQGDQSRLSFMQGQLKMWQQNWKNTQSSHLPPEEINELLAADFHQATHLAVLLPTSGPLQHAGKAIIDGIMGSYYHERGGSPTQLKLSFFDTAKGTDVVDLFKQAQVQGAEFVVGPLQKDNVLKLKQHLALPNQAKSRIPVLALNYTTTSTNTSATTASRHFFEFGLSAEDEAISVAKRAHAKGFKRVLVLRPDTDWGARVSKAFKTEFSQNNGEVLDEAAFTKPRQFSKEVQKLLGITVSRSRHKQMERELGEKLEYTPRRRQDVDFIFLLASPNEARQLKPTINYHYGQDIPVLSTSHLYTGSSNPTYDKDLNKVFFADVPWVLGQDTELQKSFEKHVPNAQNQLKRLHALGIDTFQLMREFPVLKYVSSSSLPGATGLLTIDSTGKVKRELSWAVFKKGEAKEIKSPPAATR